MDSPVFCSSPCLPRRVARLVVIGAQAPEINTQINLQDLSQPHPRCARPQQGGGGGLQRHQHPPPKQGGASCGWKVLPCPLNGHSRVQAHHTSKPAPREPLPLVNWWIHFSASTFISAEILASGRQQKYSGNETPPPPAESYLEQCAWHALVPTASNGMVSDNQRRFWTMDCG